MICKVGQVLCNCSFRKILQSSSISSLHINHSQYDYEKEAFKFMRDFKKMDKTGKVIELQKSHVNKHFNAGSTRGGQKANRSKSLVHVVHVPTKLEAEGRISRNVHINLEYAMANLRMLVDIEMKGDQSVFRIAEKKRKEKIEAERKKLTLERNAKRTNEAKLKALLDEPDTLIY